MALPCSSNAAYSLSWRDHGAYEVERLDIRAMGGEATLCTQEQGQPRPHQHLMIGEKVRNTRVQGSLR